MTKPVPFGCSLGVRVPQGSELVPSLIPFPRVAFKTHCKQLLQNKFKLEEEKNVLLRTSSGVFLILRFQTQRSFLLLWPSGTSQTLEQT